MPLIPSCACALSPQGQLLQLHGLPMLGDLAALGGGGPHGGPGGGSGGGGGPGGNNPNATLLALQLHVGQGANV